MSLEKLLNAKETPALVIGNGINRFGANAQQNSWDALLAQLAQRHLTDFSGHLPQGISLTEFYDILDLRLSAQHKRKLPKLSKAKSATNTRNLQQQFCNLMQDWRPLAQHHYIMEWARARKAPVLTSNFEHSLSEAIGAKFFIASANADDSLGLTDYYPWEAYFAVAMSDLPAAGVGI